MIDGCTICGGTDHHRSQCRLDPHRRRAEHNEKTGLAELQRRAALIQVVTEPYDECDDLIACNSCRRRGLFNERTREGCPRFVPHLAATPQRCSGFLPREARR